jgi:hypothetical protein
VLTRAICALIQRAQNVSSESENHHIQLLNILIEHCCDSGSRNHQLQSLPPLPNTPIFQVAKAMCDTVAGCDNFEVFLENFMNVDSHLSGIIKDAYLSHLLSFLKLSEVSTRASPVHLAILDRFLQIAGSHLPLTSI